MPSVFRGLLPALVLAAVTISVQAASRPSRRTTLPNFVLVVADDLRPGDLDPKNPHRAETPNLDQLAAEGLRFTDAYAGAPVAAAARAALMTGQHTGRSRVRSGIQEPLAPADITLAEVLRSVGYRSAMIGQWGLGWEGTTGIPTSQGFDEFLGSLDLFHGAEDRSGFLWRNQVAFPFSNASQSRRADAPLTWYMRGASNFMRIREDNAFLIVYAPHLPGASPVQPLAGDALNDRYTNLTWSAQDRIRAARIARLDKEVGLLIADLDRRSLTDDTVVVFTSVPGFEAAGSLPLRGKSALNPWRTGETGLQEGDLRMPLILRWPGHIQPGSTNIPVAAWDLLPTLAVLSEAPIPATATGRSVAGAWTGKEVAEGVFYWESHGTNSVQAGRGGRGRASRPVRGNRWRSITWKTTPARRNVGAPSGPGETISSPCSQNNSGRTPPADGALRAAGRPGVSVPTNTVSGPYRTNVLPMTSGGTPAQSGR